MATRNPPPPCPNADQHTPAPANYTGWHHWATRMSRTHNQVRCPGCGLYEIWIPKVARSASAPESPERPRHIGGRANAEDCPACSGTNPPYPFICPGNAPESAQDGRTAPTRHEETP